MAYPTDIEEQEKDIREAEEFTYKERRRLGQISGTVPFLEGYIRGDDPRLVGPAAIPADKSLIRSTETRPPAQHPLSKAPVSFEKIGQLNRDLGKVKNRLALKLKQTRKGSPEWASLEKQYRDAENSADDMFRLARALGRRRAGSSATDVEKQVAGRVIEGHEQTGTVASRDEIAQMKAEIEQGLLAGNETQRKTLETRVGKRGVKKLASLRTQAIKADARANAAAIEKTGKPLTDEARANPRASGLPSYVVIAMETARQKTEKFNSELAQAATLSFQRLAAGHRKLKGRRGKVTTLTPRVPPKGEQLTSVEQLIQQPGEGRARRPGRERKPKFKVGDKSTQRMLNRISRYYKKEGIHIDINLRAGKRGKKVGPTPFFQETRPTEAQIHALYYGLFRKGNVAPTEEQARGHKAALGDLRKTYDTWVREAMISQTGYKMKAEIKGLTATQKEDRANKTLDRKLHVIATTHSSQQIRDLAKAQQAERKLNIQHNLRNEPKVYIDEKLGPLGDIHELKRIVTGTQVDVPSMPGLEPLKPDKPRRPTSEAQRIYNKLEKIKPKTEGDDPYPSESKGEWVARTADLMRRLGQLDPGLFATMKAILKKRKEVFLR